MIDDNAAFVHAPNHFELVFIGPNGTVTQCFGYPPRTEDIAEARKKTDHYCVQLIGDTYEVYDLKTLRKMNYHAPMTIGLPVFESKDPDAAIMWALMNV
jgi:hypothetical protein